ncbi:MAG: dipeptidase [Simkaniaceae bacterium]
MLNWFEKNEKSIQDDYFSFLRFESISSEPKHKQDVLKCSLWLKDYLVKIGLNVEVFEGGGHPVLFASYDAGPDAKTLLIYHHYDVQPVDPLELWDSKPFEPEMRGNDVFARGAADNKGQCFYTVTALRALLEQGKKLKWNIRLLIEGEEEVGSPSLPTLLEQNKEKLKADQLLIVDVDLPAKNVPGVTLGARGIVTFDVTCRGSNADLHSGNHGGLALNPNKALVNMLSALWSETGSIAIPHFYDSLETLEKEELKHYFLDFDEEEYQKKFGVRSLDMEHGISPIVSNWLRPSLEINGIWGGYTGEGFKTVIPAEAHAKLSCRLPPNLVPEEVSQQICDFLQKKSPTGMDVEVVCHGGFGGFRTSPDQEFVGVVAEAFESVFHADCRYILTGGSIPIAIKIAEICNVSPILIGTGLMSDNIHSPNEHFGWDRFKQGFLVMSTILSDIDLDLTTEN